jgi:hypothetical protein
MHHAMRGLIQTVLSDVAATGCRGITISSSPSTRAGRVSNSRPWLRERYPEEMTIVIQHWYDDLDVTDDGFSITLNFGDSPERLRVPFDAILTFVDPPWSSACASRPRRRPTDRAAAMTIPIPRARPDGDRRMDDAPPSQDAEVVSLDTFRRKH